MKTTKPKYNFQRLIQLPGDLGPPLPAKALSVLTAIWLIVFTASKFNDLINETAKEDTTAMPVSLLILPIIILTVSLSVWGLLKGRRWALIILTTLYGLMLHFKFISFIFESADINDAIFTSFYLVGFMLTTTLWVNFMQWLN